MSRSVRSWLSIMIVGLLCLSGIPYVKPSAIPTASAAGSTITRSGNVWTLENDVMRVSIIYGSGSIEMTSFYNKEAGVEYLTGSGSKHLFYHNYGGSALYSNDGGWTLGTAVITDIQKFGVHWGKALEIPVTRTSPQHLTVTLRFEMYNDRAGLNYSNRIKNHSASNKTITESDIVALNLPDNPHTLHYVPNMTWSSTRGALAPNTGRNAISVYDSGDGWIVQPEMNWKTLGPVDRLPFANINAWSGIDGVKVSTNPGSLQLVLFPNEEFEYLSVNMTTFQGDILDGKMAMEEHFRKRFKYHDTKSIFLVNDWDWHWDGQRSDAYYRSTVIPRAVQSGLDMIMPDDFWNTTRDTTTPASSFTTDLQSLTDEIVESGLQFGLWFSMTGDNHMLGRDLADPAQIEFKRSQVEDFMIPEYHLTHQMIDLTEFWPNASATSTSHPSDSVYRKNVLTRNYLNDLTTRHPDFIGKLTSEVDIHPTQGDRNIGLLHIADNGFVSSKGDVDKDLQIGMNHFGYLPMNAVYYGGAPTGKMEDYYSYMLARAIKFKTDPGTWTDPAMNALKKFNDWRKSPRILEMTNQATRPLYAGPNYDTSGPYAWMYRTEDKRKALVIVTAAGETGAATELTLDLRWLDDNKTYLVEDITMNDNGTSAYAYKGRYTGAQLKAPGLTVNLTENTSKGKAFWIQEDNQAAAMQVLYADEKVTSYTETEGESRLTVNATGPANTTGKVVVFDRPANRAIVSDVAIGAGGTGSVTVESGAQSEAETLATTVSAGDNAANASDSAASGGSLSYGNLNAVGDWIAYSVNVPSAGTYNVKVRVKKHPDRGIGQLYIDGAPHGTPIDHYAATQGYAEANLGDYTFSSPGDKAFRFQVTGKHASAASYKLATDTIRLTFRSPNLLLPPPVPEPVKYESENLPATVSAGDSHTNANESGASNKALHYANVNAVGDWVDYAVNVPSPGTYRVKVQVKKHPNRGMAQLSIDGAPQGSPIDLYQASQGFVLVDLGDASFSSAGTKSFRFQVTGKHASSGAYTLATDYIALTKQPLQYEAEGLPTTVSSGDNQVDASDSAASGGSLNYGNFNETGDWIEYTVNVPQPGTYVIGARVKKHPDRGTSQLYVDGIAQGEPVDQYREAQGYEVVGLGSVTFGTAGNKQFRFQVTGRNPASGSYTLAYDRIILTRTNG